MPKYPHQDQIMSPFTFINNNSMRRQAQFNNNKSYSSHLKRLINIRGNFNPKQATSPFNHNLSASQHKSVRSKRALTEQNALKREKTSSSRIPISLPLVGLRQRELLSKSLSVRKIPQRQAQIVLENYLLSKRLLKAKPSINKNEQDRDYEKHEIYSHLRSKSKLEEIKLSQSRLLKYKEFQHSQRRKLSSRFSSTLGTGKYVFTIKINSFQRVHKKQDRNSLYNVTLKLGKRGYDFKHLSLRALLESRSFYFRKSDLKFPNLLFGQFEEIIQTDCIKIGTFSVDLNEVYEKLNAVGKHDDFRYEKEDEIEGIRTARSELLIGTIAFNYSITRVKE